MAFQDEHSGHLPTIDSYGDGVFHVNEREFKGSILIWRGGVYPWSAATIADVSVEGLSVLLDKAADIDVVLFGTGETSVILPRPVRDILSAKNIAYDVMNTGAAARTFNMLLADGRRVAAAIFAV